LVDTVQGRKMVRCVTSPALFLDEYFEAPSRRGAGPQSSLGVPSRAGSVVQVGSFAVPSNAARLQARLQNAGMPVRVSQSRGLSVVSVGPFSNAGQAQSALSQVRQMGFQDAFLR
jgi:cell division septation protein DedD